ncbi:MAG: HNH endonuclease signature motif containing protein [Clostridiaceae bacterium]
MARHPEIYATTQWEKARCYVIMRAYGLCERCLKDGAINPGKIVHHIVWLTYNNKHDWNIAYNPDNLIYLCNSCHEEIHKRTSGLNKFINPPRGRRF